MKMPRRNHSVAFKTRVALEALRGAKTLAELAAHDDVYPHEFTKNRRKFDHEMPDLPARRA
jgi:transposase